VIDSASAPDPATARPAWSGTKNSFGAGNPATIAQAVIPRALGFVCRLIRIKDRVRRFGILGSSSRGDRYAHRFDSDFCSCGIGVRGVCRRVDLGQFSDRTGAAGTGRAQQKTPQLLANLLPATNRAAPVFPNKIDLDQIIGGGITADAQAQLRKRIDK
jgi:hypothetical protein